MPCVPRGVRGHHLHGVTEPCTVQLRVSESRVSGSGVERSRKKDRERDIERERVAAR